MHIVNSSIQNDGARKAIVYFYMASDGASDELTNRDVLDLKNDIVPIGRKINITLEQIWWCNTGFDVLISSSDAPEVPLWVLPAGTDSHIDFRAMGGLRLATGLDDNQALQFTTRNFADDATKKGTMIIAFRKD